MKKLLRIVAVFAVTLTMVFAASTTAFAASDTANMFSQSGCTANQITFKVDLTKFTPSYIPNNTISVDITNWTITDNNSGMVVYEGVGKVNEDVVINQDSAYSAYYKLTVNYTYTTPSYTSKSSKAVWSYATTKPANIKKAMLSSYVYTSLNKAYFTGGKDSSATGIEYQYAPANGGKAKKILTTSSMTNSFAISKNVPYKYRARNYYANQTNGKTYYGNYSPYRYFINPTISGSNNSSRNGITVNIKGAKNVKYQIYVAKDRDGSYKLTKTVTPKAGKTSSYLINKIGKKNMSKSQTYYIKFVPYVNKVKCDTVFIYSAYNSWY